MIAGIGSGIFADYVDAQKLAPVFNIVTPPNEEHARRYEACYSDFLELYPRLKAQRAS